MTRVAPPVTALQAARIEPLGLLADDPAGLHDAWARVEIMWATTTDRAMTMSDDALDQRVGDGWSFFETLRHLVFVTDSWIGRVLLELPSPHDPIGVPPDFIDGTTLGLDLGAHPTRGEVLSSRAARQDLVRDTIDRTTVEQLDRTCAPVGNQFTVLGAVQVVIFEEWAHHEYAVRDLAIVG